MSEPPVPRATYRLQFHKDFGFADAAALAPYLARLGISHVYASPYLKARPGSTHGYDIVDHRQLNPELGGESAFRDMVKAFRDNGLGQVLDFVPNHMGVGGADNLCWQDVLEWGPDSEYAGWFDIDWEPDTPSLRGKLLVPFLGDQYGAVLEAGDLALRFDPDSGDFAVWAYDTHKLPICPLHYERLVRDAHPLLVPLGEAFGDLSNLRPSVASRAKDLRSKLSALALERDDVRDALDRVVTHLNGESGRLETWRGLDALIKDQHWRAAHFRVAADDINYRRFFNINDLAGLRMELPELFDHAHGLVFDLLRDGTLDGLRIDHVDGLLDPKAYLVRLREHAQRPFYLVVEKILARHETLPEDWPVEGTTGYEFTNLVLGFLVDPAGETAFTELYTQFTGAGPSFDEIVRDCKLRIMRNEMASELNVLGRDAVRIARQNPRTADFTRNILQRGLREIVACFPVYRTYVDGGAAPSDADLRDLDWAVAWARRNQPDLDPSVFDFLYRLLSGDHSDDVSRRAVTNFAMRVQQYSGPVMAKGLEDTAFYRYNRFVALNEVGGHPDHFGVSMTAFHRTNAQRAARSPHAMLGTSTHDTKRGEDVRARLAVLAEMPDEWAHLIPIWNRILRARLGDLEGTAPPGRNDEYLFYQLLLGAWPAEQTVAVGIVTERLEAAMVKSMREAKQHTNWALPNTDYEEAMLNFIRSALDISRPNAFLESFLPFQQRVARFGVLNSLVQTTLKLTVPGMPDIYQGSELWDLGLVDPDNRRPVDYVQRERMLAEMTMPPGCIHDLRTNWSDGRIKLAVTSMLLAERRDHPALYANGSYEPLPASGSKSDHICAFARTYEESAVLVIATRFPVRLAANPGWNNTSIAWPRALNRVTRMRDLFTGRIVECGQEAMDIEALLGPLPMAVYVPA